WGEGGGLRGARGRPEVTGEGGGALDGGIRGGPGSRRRQGAGAVGRIEVGEGGAVRDRARLKISARQGILGQARGKKPRAGDAQTFRRGRRRPKGEPVPDRIQALAKPTDGLPEFGVEPVPGRAAAIGRTWGAGESGARRGGRLGAGDGGAGQQAEQRHQGND